MATVFVCVCGKKQLPLQTEYSMKIAWKDRMEIA